MLNINQARFREVMLRHTDAGTWIANRSNPWQALLAIVLIEQGLRVSTQTAISPPVLVPHRAPSGERSQRTRCVPGCVASSAR